MRMAMVRVGIDSGCGRMQGPLFHDGSFEYIPIPDGCGKDERTYQNTTGRYGRKLLEYFPRGRWKKFSNHPIHFDPEFSTYTYGDPTPPKAGLRHLQRGDLLVFYCGLQGWDFQSAPALYLLGYFDVEIAGKASEFSQSELINHFQANFHVRHKDIFEKQKSNLVLVKGSVMSKLFDKAICISSIGKNSVGRPIKVLSKEMQTIFGDFDGKICFQRSPTRWVMAEFIERAEDFVKGL